ncbi:MAG: NTP transferase domain-containing protein [Candidatus Aminicenantes bacterium]|nr:NTP transferase domain-containing protein [Candidatus Aminicenantes bacterium]
MSLTLLVLAAGMGSRYGGLKQIDPVGPGGETLLDYSVYDAVRAGFDRVVFIVRGDMESDFRDAAGRRIERRVAVEYCRQELEMVPGWFSIPPERRKPWGTGHAVLAARNAIDGNFAAVNADDFYGAGSYRKLAGHLQQAADCRRGDYGMVGFRLRETLSDHGTVARGVCRSRQGLLEEVVELTRIARTSDGAVYFDSEGQAHNLSGDELVSMNMWGFTPSIFDHLERAFARFLRERGGEDGAEFMIPTLVNDLVAAGQARVRVLRSSDAWFGVTYREDRDRVTSQIRELVSGGAYPERLWGE